jgi:hypothetical protein
MVDPKPLGERLRGDFKKSTAKQIAMPFAEKPTFMETAKASFLETNKEFAIFSSESDFVNSFARATIGSVARDEGWDPEDHISGELEPYRDMLFHTRNKEDFDNLVLDIESSKQRREALDKGGIAADIIGGGLGMITSPSDLLISALPFIGAYRKGKKITSLGRMQTAAMASTGVTAATAANEAVLQITDPLRTGEESLYNIASSAIISAGFGAALPVRDSLQARLPTSVRPDKQFVDDLEKEILSELHGFPNPIQEKYNDLYQEAMKTDLNKKDSEDWADEYFDATRGRTVGAMMIPQPSKETKVAGGDVFMKAAGMFKRTNPKLDVAMSSSPKARELGKLMFPTHLATKENIEGVKTPRSLHSLIEVRMKGSVGQATDTNVQNYKKYKKRTKDLGDKPITEEEFGFRIFQSLMKGETDHVPEIAASVSKYRKFYEEYLDDAVEAGLLKKTDALYANKDKYVPIFHMQDKIAANRDDWMRLAMEGARGRANNIRMTVEMMKKAGDDIPEDLADIAKMTDYQIGEEIRDLYNKIISKDNEYAGLLDHFSGEAVSNRFSARHRLLDHELLLDYIDTDIKRITSMYARNVTPDIEFNKAGLGKGRIESRIEEVEAEYNELIKAAPPNKVASINREKARIVGQLNYMADILRHRTGFTTQTSEGIRHLVKGVNALNFTRFMGMFPLATVSEIGMTALNHGFQKTYGTSFTYFAERLNGIKISKEQAARMATAVDGIMGDRIKGITGFSDTNINSKYEHMIDSGTNMFAKSVGMHIINDTLRTIGTSLEARNITDGVTAIVANTATPRQITEMALFGIDKSNAKEVFDMIKKHGDVYNKNNDIALNFHKWENKRLAHEINASIYDMVNRSTTIADEADLPKMAQSTIGQVAFHLKSFVFAVNNKILLPQVQKMSIHGVSSEQKQGFAVLMALGLLSHVLYEKAKGREIDTNPYVLFVNSLDRTGVLGLGMEVNNMLDRTVGLGIGDQDKMSRWMEGTDALLGTGGALVNDITNLVENPTSRRIEKLSPGQNHIMLEAIKRIIEASEE